MVRAARRDLERQLELEEIEETLAEKDVQLGQRDQQLAEMKDHVRLELGDRARPAHGPTAETY